MEVAPTPAQVETCPVETEEDAEPTNATMDTEDVEVETNGPDAEGDDSALMQSALSKTAGADTGLRDARWLLHQLQTLPVGQATRTARHLHQRLLAICDRVSMWEETQAVLVSMLDVQDTCESPEDGDLVDEWYRILVGPQQGDRATSSSDPMPAPIRQPTPCCRMTPSRTHSRCSTRKSCRGRMNTT